MSGCSPDLVVEDLAFKICGLTESRGKDDPRVSLAPVVEGFALVTQVVPVTIEREGFRARGC